jgi:hypothetical protein
MFSYGYRHCIANGLPFFSNSLIPLQTAGRARPRSCGDDEQLSRRGGQVEGLSVHGRQKIKQAQQSHGAQNDGHADFRHFRF